MIIPASSDNWIALRVGLLKHLEKGYINLKEFAVFCLLLMLADRTTGTVLTNAKILSERSRLNLKDVQNAIYHLRARQYIHYEDRRGVKGPYTIFINKYRIRVKKDCYFYTHLFRESTFIGEEIFYAQMKVLNLYPVLGSGFRLSFESFRLSNEFTIDFTIDFEELTKRIDLYTSIPFINRWLCDFVLDFKKDNPQTFIRHSDIELDIYILKESKTAIPLRKEPDREDKQRMAEFCNQLKNLNHGFDPIAFVRYNVNANIPFEVTEFILRQLIKYKSKIDHVWPYAMEILRKEYQHRNYAKALEEHEEMKAFDMVEALKKVKMID